MPPQTFTAVDITGFPIDWDDQLGPITFAPQLLAFSSRNYVAPTVNVVSPSPGRGITKDTPLVLDVQDTGLRRVIIGLSFLGAEDEFLAFDGDQFAGRFTTSSRLAIDNGWRFSLRRKGGWPGSPRLRVWAYDSDGNEA